MNGFVAGETGGALPCVRRWLCAALVTTVVVLLPAHQARADLTADIAEAAQSVDDANKAAQDNIPGNHRIKDAEDALDRAARTNDDTPANASQQTKDANQAAEDLARSEADALRADMADRQTDEQKERQEKYRKALEERREARQRLKELEREARRNLGAVRTGPFDQAAVKEAAEVVNRVRRKLAESEAAPAPQMQTGTQAGRMQSFAPSSKLLKPGAFQPVKAKLVTDSQQYCTFGKAAPATVSFAPTDSPPAPKPPEQPSPGNTPSAGGETPPGKPTPPDKPPPTAGNPPGGGSTPAKPGNAPPPPERPQADGGPSQVAGGPASGGLHLKKKKRRRYPHGPPQHIDPDDPMESIDPSPETASPEDILDDLGDEEFNRSVLGTQFGPPLNESPASKPPAAEAGTPPEGPQQASGSPEDILSEIEEGSTPSKADTTKTPPSAAPPSETPAGKGDKPATVTGLPGAPQTATPVAIYFKAKETVLEGEADKNLEIKQQVVKLVPVQEPELPMTTGSNGVPSDAVKTAVAKKALDSGYDKSPVQCTTGENGECSAEIPAEERELYGFPKTGVGSYRAEFNTLQNSGGVVENLSGLLKSKLMDLPPPKGLNVVKSTFKIGERTYVRLTYAGPADRIGALTSDYAKHFGKNYQVDFCEEKKPGPPLGMDLSSFHARGRELPEAAVKLGAESSR